MKIVSVAVIFIIQGGLYGTLNNMTRCLMTIIKYLLVKQHMADYKYGKIIWKNELLIY